MCGSVIYGSAAVFSSAAVRHVRQCGGNVQQCGSGLWVTINKWGDVYTLSSRDEAGV
jgi:hypothetical protein